MKIKVLGSKDFLNTPAGTFYAEIEIGQDSASIEEQVDFIIRQIKLGEGWFDCYIDNDASLSFEEFNKEYDIKDVWDPENDFIWDHNVIGDATPETTLYIIIPEEIILDEVNFENTHLTKEEILKIRDNLINSIYKDYRDNSKNPRNNWARGIIKLNYNNHPIVNYNQEIEVE